MAIMCTAGQRVSLTITDPGPSFMVQIDGYAEKDVQIDGNE